MCAVGLHPRTVGAISCLGLTLLLSVRLAGEEHLVVQPPPSLVQSLAFSPKGDVFAAGFDDSREAMVYDAKRPGRPVAIRGEHGHARALAFSPDGKTVAVPDAWQPPGEEQELVGVRLWDPRKGTERARLSGHVSFVTAVAFSPDGDRLVTGDDKGNVLLWNIAKGQLMWKLVGHDDEVTAAAFSPDGKAVVTTGRDKGVVVADVPTGKISTRLRGHATWVLAVAFADDGKTLLTADGGGEVRSWDFPAGKLRATTTFKRNGRNIGLAAVAFGPGGRLAATVEDAGSVVRVWAVSDGSELAAFEHTKLHTSTCLTFAPDGLRLVSGARAEVPFRRSEIRIWDISKVEVPQKPSRK